MMFGVSSAIKQSSNKLFQVIEHNVKLFPIAKISSSGTYETLNVTVPKPYVYHVELNRPQKVNAMNMKMWIDLKTVFDKLSEDSKCRAIVLSGAGKMFSGGMDIVDFMKLAPELAEIEDIARKAKIIHSMVRVYQKGLSSLEVCPKPVIGCVHNASIGAGVELITAVDMRYCTKDAYFQVKEVNIGMAADGGTLQRLPKIIRSDSLVRELCYTGRKMLSDEALLCGLVSKVFDDKNSMLEGAFKTAEEIASQSPVAVQGTKVSLVYSRDHSVQEGLDHIARWNQAMMQSEDFVNATMAQLAKQEATFTDL